MKFPTGNFEFGLSHGTLYERRRRLENNFCFCFSASASQQQAQNQQVAVQGGTAPTVGTGAGSTNTINITDSGTVEAALETSAYNFTEATNLAAHGIDSSTTVAVEAIAANKNVDDTAINDVSKIAGQSQENAVNIADNSLNLVNENTAENYTALENNTAMAFSTIDHLITGQTAGQDQAASDAAAAELAAAKAYGASASAPAASQPVFSPVTENTTPATSDSLGKYYNLVWIAVGGFAIWAYLKKGKAPA